MTTLNMLKIALRQLEKRVLLTGPDLVCDDCYAWVSRGTGITFDDIPHKRDCILRQIKEHIKEVDMMCEDASMCISPLRSSGDFWNEQG